jgi:hypothetical protein
MEIISLHAQNISQESKTTRRADWPFFYLFSLFEISTQHIGNSDNMAVLSALQLELYCPTDGELGGTSNSL